MKTYIAFEIGRESFKWLVPENMTLAQGLTKVFETNYSKQVREKLSNQRKLVITSISLVDGNKTKYL